MTDTEIFLFLWLGLHSGALVWLCLERDRLLKKISALDSVVGWLLSWKDKP